MGTLVVRRVFGSVVLCAVLGLWSGCSSTTPAHDPPLPLSNGLPSVGSIFTYADSTFDAQGKLIAATLESDTVLASGITVLGQPNAVLLSANAKNALLYTRMTYDSLVDPKPGLRASTLVQNDNSFGPTAYAIGSNDANEGDFFYPGGSMVRRSMQDSTVVGVDSAMIWYRSPTHTHVTTVHTVFPACSVVDSLRSGQPSNFVVQGKEYVCEHGATVRVPTYDAKSNFLRTDIYFSPELGAPVAITAALGNWYNSITARLHSRTLVRYELR